MGLGSLGQVSYDIVCDDQTSGPVGSATGSLEGLTTTLGDVRDALQTISGVMEGTAKGYANLDSYSSRLQMTTGLTADATTDLINTMWNVTDPLDEAGGMLLELAKNGYTTEEELRTLGFQFADFGDAVNISAEIAVAKFMPALRSLGVPTDEVGGALDKLGYLTTQYSLDANQLSTLLVRMGGEMGKYGLSVDDVANALKVLTDKGYSGREAMKVFNEAIGESTDLNGDGKISQEEFAQALGVTTEELEGAAKSLEGATGWNKEYAASFNRMFTPLETVNQQVTEYTSNLGPLPGLISGVAGPMAGLTDILLSLAAIKTLGGLTGLSSGLSTIMAIPALATLAPILIGIALGAAAVYGLNELGVLDWVYDMGYAFGGIVMDSGAAFESWCEGVPGFVMGMVEGIGSGVSSIPGIISTAFGGISDTIGSVLVSIPGALTGSFSLIAEAFSALGGRVQEAFSNLFTGISEFIVGLAQGFISAGYNIIMYIVQGMQSAAGAIGDTIGNIFNIIGQFIPHSPAETGPLSQLPNFGAYFVDPLLATVPAVEAASVQVAEAVAMPAAQPASMSGGTQIGYQDNSAPIDIGSINASSDYPIDKIMADIAAMQAQKRTQRGYTT